MVSCMIEVAGAVGSAADAAETSAIDRTAFYCTLECTFATASTVRSVGSDSETVGAARGDGVYVSPP